MKKAALLLVGLLGSSPVFAQDFLQQWVDNATKAMKDFRTAHASRIEAAGWHFVGGSLTIEGVPQADLYLREVKAGEGASRAAMVLNAYYTPVPAFDFPEHQSMRALLNVDCGNDNYQERASWRYASADGSGEPNASTPERPTSNFRDNKHAQPQTAEKTLVDLVCAAKR